MWKVAIGHPKSMKPEYLLNGILPSSVACSQAFPHIRHGNGLPVAGTPDDSGRRKPRRRCHMLVRRQ
jgi:hypothetical protein